MNEMIERVSRTLYPERWEGHDVGRELEPDYWASPMEIEERERLLARARTAIEAMREPTEAMADSYLAGSILCRIADAAEASGEFLGGFKNIHEAAAEIWRAMIDAALEP